MPYSFGAQLEQGESGESFLDRFFSRWFRIEPATHDEQRSGIDRYFYDRKHPRLLLIEYKTDTLAAQTGNAFIETVSVDTADRAGWVFTSKADLLLYFVPGKHVIYILRLEAIRLRLPYWSLVYDLREVPNKGYHTHGLLVPLDELARCAERVVNCSLP